MYDVAYEWMWSIYVTCTRALMNIMYSNKNRELKFVAYISQNSILNILLVIEKNILSASNSTLKIKKPFIFLSNSSWKAKIKTKTRNDVMDCMILQFLHKMVFQIINCAGHKSILHNSVILTFFWYEFLMHKHSNLHEEDLLPHVYWEIDKFYWNSNKKKYFFFHSTA